MALLFRNDELQITTDWIRCAAGSFSIRTVASAWVVRRHAERGSRALTAGLGTAALVIVIGGAGLSGHLDRVWRWLIAAPLIFLAVAWVGLLDPLAIYLEKRRHELWITVNGTDVCLWKANLVEANKALRAIQRAREQFREEWIS